MDTEQSYNFTQRSTWLTKGFIRVHFKSMMTQRQLHHQTSHMSIDNDSGKLCSQSSVNSQAAIVIASKTLARILGNGVSFGNVLRLVSFVSY